jgi:hypothetical protein
VSISFGGFGMGGFGHSGSAPSPFDAINGGRLAGGASDHPLHDVSIDELLKPSEGQIGGSITIDKPVKVGDPITGRIELIANSTIKARHAYLRLVGLRLVEQKHSSSQRVGNTTTTQTWVQADGSLFVEDPFLEPAIPAELEPGQQFSATFAIPGPPLGPPTAHLGEAIVAWAVEVRWDIAMGTDAHVATLLTIAQNPDLVAAGVGEQGGLSMLASVDVGGGTISIESPLPAHAGTNLIVHATWPSAHSGKGRIELHRFSSAPNGISAVIASVPTSSADLSSGAARVELPVPSDATPSFDGAGLSLGYLVRVLIDRRFMRDDAIERMVAVV